MNEIIEFIEKDMLAKYLGIKFLFIEKGRASAEMEINKNHLNSIGIVHGGAIFSLADTVFAAASNSQGRIAVAINASISYFKATKEGKLTGTAEEISLNKKLATYLVKISDNDGNVIALFQGTAYRKEDIVPGSQ
jgi:acyl-CoA thioesterase